MAEVKWTKTALQDLKSIGNYIEQDSLSKAKQVIQKIYSSTNRLEQYPESGRIIPEFQNNEYREIIVKPYRVFYLIKNETIYILSIIHSKRDV